MGLDQYAYAAAKAKQREEYYTDGNFDKETGEWVNLQSTKPIEIAYWRKHPNLQGWMERLWAKKGYPNRRDSDNKLWETQFNGIELELTWDDLGQLERDIMSGQVANLETTGFFFGSYSDDYYREQDLKFIRDAKSHLFVGLKVFYNSSW